MFFFSPEWVQEGRPGKPPPAARAEARGLNPAALRTPRLCLVQRGARKNCFKICFKILFTCPCAILFFLLNLEERHQDMRKYFSGANALYYEEIKFLLSKVPIQP